MQKYPFITIDSVLAKFSRDFRGLDIDKYDAVEWIAEALGFMKIVTASKHSVIFIVVENYQCEIPKGLHHITQIARNNEWVNPNDTQLCIDNTIEELCDECNTDCSLDAVPIVQDADGNLIGEYEPVYYRPFYNLQYEYLGWANSNARRNKYTPVVLSNHSFFDTLVCKEEGMEDLYCPDCLTGDEYTIAGDELRFNFKDGFVAIAYTGSMLDIETGYPMIPDDESCRAAITYYLTWKFKQNEMFNHIEGASQLSKEAESQWLKYVKQFKNKAKMPYGVDQYQNLANQSNRLIPPRGNQFGFFGRLGKEEVRQFNNPNRRL